MGEWKEYKLKELTTKIGSGATPTGGGNSYKLEGTSLIRSQNVLDLSFSINGLAFIDDDQANGLRNVIVEKNDILLNITGDSVARVCKVPEKILPARVNQHVAILRPIDSKLNYDFLLYYLYSVKEQLLSIAEIGATRNALTKGMIEDFSIIVPSIKEQRTIATILSSLDDKIDLLHRQNKTLEAMAETLFRQWFVEEKKDSWSEGKLGDIISLIESGSRPKGGINPDLKIGIPSIGAENINGIGVYDFSRTKFVSEDFYNSMNRGIIKNYDVLIYKDGAYIGRKGMFGNKFPFEVATVNEHVFILRANDKANQFFLYYLLEQEELEQLNANSAQPGLNQESMRNFKIIIPPIDLITKFGYAVQPLVDKILLNSTQARCLAKLRDELLPKLMNGEVTITNA